MIMHEIIGQYTGDDDEIIRLIDNEISVPHDCFDYGADASRQWTWLIEDTAIAEQIIAKLAILGIEVKRVYLH